MHAQVRVNDIDTERYRTSRGHSSREGPRKSVQRGLVGGLLLHAEQNGAVGGTVRYQAAVGLFPGHGQKIIKGRHFGSREIVSEIRVAPLRGVVLKALLGGNVR